MRIRNMTHSENKKKGMYIMNTIREYFKNLFLGEEEPSPERPLTKREMIKEAVEGFAFMLLLGAVTFLAILILG